MDDVLSFANKLKLPISTPAGPNRAYFSNLEIHMEPGLGDHVAKVAPLSAAILTKLKSYGLLVESVPLFGFKLLSDTTGMVPPIPTEFAFERRAGHAFSSSLYISS